MMSNTGPERKIVLLTAYPDYHSLEPAWITQTVESVATMKETNAISMEHFKWHMEHRNGALPLFLPNSSSKNTAGKKTAVDPDLQPYYMIHDELSIVDDCIVRGTYCLVVPGSLQKHLIHVAHKTHQGIARTKQWLRELY